VALRVWNILVELGFFFFCYVTCTTILCWRTKSELLRESSREKLRVLIEESVKTANCRLQNAVKKKKIHKRVLGWTECDMHECIL